MWVLYGAGSPRWLRPGRTYVLGRSGKGAAIDMSLNESSVSRRHAKITVPVVDSLRLGSPSIRSEVTVQDLNSRFGTFIDGEKLEPNQPHPLPSRESETNLRIGAKTTLAIVWRPMVITLSSGEKGTAHDALWESVSANLEPLEIKLTPNFISQTTHYMTGTRRSSKLVFALARNMSIVDSRFAESLNASMDAMEKDFDRGMPDATMFLPDPEWAPNPARERCLESQAFAFLDEEQYEALAPSITCCGGKCQLFTDIDTVSRQSPPLILVLPAEQTAADQARTSGNTLVDPVALLPAIRDAVPVSLIPAGIPTSETSRTGATKRKERLQKANLLDFMSSAPKGKTESPPASTSLAGEAQSSAPTVTASERTLKRKAPRPQRTGMLDFMSSVRNKDHVASTVGHPAVQIADPVTTSPEPQSGATQDLVTTPTRATEAAASSTDDFSLPPSKRVKLDGMDTSDSAADTHLEPLNSLGNKHGQGELESQRHLQAALDTMDLASIDAAQRTSQNQVSPDEVERLGAQVESLGVPEIYGESDDCPAVVKTVDLAPSLNRQIDKNTSFSDYGGPNFKAFRRKDQVRRTPQLAQVPPMSAALSDHNREDDVLFDNINTTLKEQSTMGLAESPSEDEDDEFSFRFS